MNNHYYPPYPEQYYWPIGYPAPQYAYRTQSALPTAAEPPPATGTPIPAAPATASSGSFLTNPNFIKGALIGAAAAYLLTNESVQDAAVKGAVRGWSLLQGSIEEMKERFRDAEAELHTANFGQE